MRIVRLILSAALGASALVGIQILATDYWLWSASPTHAYGLMAFVALDFALIVGVWRLTRLALFWSSADGNSPTAGDARGHYRGRTGWPSGSGLQELPLGRHSLRWPAHYSGPHHGNHHRNLGSTSSPWALVSLVENIQKVSREIHPGSRSNLREGP